MRVCKLLDTYFDDDDDDDDDDDAHTMTYHVKKLTQYNYWLQRD